MSHSCHHTPSPFDKDLLTKSPSATAAEGAAEGFKLLADPTRLRIFWLLCHTEACPSKLSSFFAISAPNLSHHLRLLREGGLLLSRREGKEVVYGVAPSPKTRLLHRAAEELMQIACPEYSADFIHHEHPQKGEAEDEAPLERLHDYVARNLDKRITIASLARRASTNPTTLQRAFKARYGASLAVHMREHRMKRASYLLRETDMPVSEIARAVSYRNASKFSAAFAAYFSLSPLSYRKRHRPQ
ncbi:MAG: metalloregulator ArsR/SmtB family transcription factor [Clostridia bacterium]|nr:metalloregulator ArsR/SmtB family transcription factor [Clostridia bacterium]